jgi:hypothetical protein
LFEGHRPVVSLLPGEVARALEAATILDYGSEVDFGYYLPYFLCSHY